MIDCSVYSLESSATVEEAGTGVQLGGKGRVSITRNVITFKPLYKDEFMKPNLPFTVKVPRCLSFLSVFCFLSFVLSVLHVFLLISVLSVYACQFVFVLYVYNHVSVSVFVCMHVCSVSVILKRPFICRICILPSCMFVCVHVFSRLCQRY